MAPKYRGIRNGRYLLVKYGDGSLKMHTPPGTRSSRDEHLQERRYAPIKKFLLKHLSKLTKCSGADCAQQIGKPPKPLAKPKKRR